MTVFQLSNGTLERCIPSRQFCALSAFCRFGGVEPLELLLGYAGRVSLSKAVRFAHAMEFSVNKSGAHPPLNFGHMTDEEVCSLVRPSLEAGYIPARDRAVFELDLKIREARIREKNLRDPQRRAVAEGEQRGFLDAARAVLALQMPADELERAVESLAQLKSIADMKVALVELVSGARQA